MSYMLSVQNPEITNKQNKTQDFFLDLAHLYMIIFSGIYIICCFCLQNKQQSSEVKKELQNTLSEMMNDDDNPKEVISQHYTSVPCTL